MNRETLSGREADDVDVSPAKAVTANASVGRRRNSITPPTLRNWRRFWFPGPLPIGLPDGRDQGQRQHEHNQRPGNSMDRVRRMTVDRRQKLLGIEPKKQGQRDRHADNGPDGAPLSDVGFHLPMIVGASASRHCWRRRDLGAWRIFHPLSFNRDPLFLVLNSQSGADRRGRQGRLDR